jgi:virginiamycin B lyase
MEMNIRISHRRRGMIVIGLVVVILAGLWALCPSPVSAAPGTITEFNVPAGSTPYDMCRGADGQMWFTENGTNKIGSISPEGNVAEYPITPGSIPEGIACGPGGAIWFCEHNTHKIGRINADGTGYAEVATPTAGSSPMGICLGPDGAMWFCEYGVNRIGRITTDGIITEYPLPGPSAPSFICAGPDGALWFTEYIGDKIGRITTGGVVSHHSLAVGSAPCGIATGPDGALWFTECTAHKIGRLTTGGTLDEVTIAAGTIPYLICRGPDDMMWFTEYNGNKVSSITMAGAVHEVALPVAGSVPAGIAVSMDQCVWFVENHGNRIGRLEVEKPAWYLAEGSTAWGFSTRINIENPNATAVHAAVTYMTSTGPVAGGTVALPARSQASVDPAEILGPRDFSTRVICTEMKTIAVDRGMYWTATNAAFSEGHSSVGVVMPSNTWFLAEGSSQWGFEDWTLVQNPNAVPVTAQLTYMIEGDAPQTVVKTVPAYSRATFNMADDIGAKDASVKVVSTLPVIAERAMYRNHRREGHDSIGTISPAKSWWLAEGSTAWGFTEYVLVQNPNPGPANIGITYLTSSGPQVQPAFTMPANSRRTIRVNDALADRDLSTQVVGDKPVIAERAMYWNNGTGEACHDSIGVNGAHAVFYFPDGEASTSSNIETWTLVANTNATAVNVQISYLAHDGVGNVTFTDTIPPMTRSTFNMIERYSGSAAVEVRCLSAGKKITAERAMYWNNKEGGTNTIGSFAD